MSGPGGVHGCRPGADSASVGEGGGGVCLDGRTSGMSSGGHVGGCGGGGSGAHGDGGDCGRGSELAGGGPGGSDIHEADAPPGDSAAGATRTIPGSRMEANKGENIAKGTNDHRHKGNVCGRSKHKRVCMRGKQPVGEDGSLSEDEDDDDDAFMTPPRGSRDVPQPAHPQTRSSSRGGIKKARPNNGTIPPKRNVTFKEPSSPSNQKRKSMEADLAEASMKAKRPSRAEKKETAKKAPRWNVRSSPVQVKKMLASLTPDQRRIFVEDTGFSSLLHFNIETPIPPAFLQWLMIHITHETMYIRVGSGKKIKITKEVFHHILGLSNQGVSQERGMQWSEKSTEAKRLRKQLGVKKAKDLNVKFCMDKIREGGTDDLTKRCFFLVLFNRLLFPTCSWQMSNSEIERTKDMTNYANIDWCHEIYTDVCNQMREFHESLKEDQVSYTLPGCSVAIALYYLDWLDHKKGPQDRFKLPRISVFDSEIISALLAHDVIRDRQTIVGFGALDFRPASQTCYTVAPDLGSIYIPTLSKMLRDKILELRGPTRSHFQSMLAAYDQDVQRQCQSIQSSIRNIVQTQQKMKEIFWEMVDDVIRHQGNVQEDVNEVDERLTARNREERHQKPAEGNAGGFENSGVPPNEHTAPDGGREGRKKGLIDRAVEEIHEGEATNSAMHGYHEEDGTETGPGHSPVRDEHQQVGTNTPMHYSKEDEQNTNSGGDGGATAVGQEHQAANTDAERELRNANPNTSNLKSDGQQDDTTPTDMSQLSLPPLSQLTESQVDIAYAPLIEGFQIFFAGIKHFDITEGRVHIHKFIRGNEQD